MYKGKEWTCITLKAILHHCLYHKPCYRAVEVIISAILRDDSMVLLRAVTMELARKQLLCQRVVINWALNNRLVDESNVHELDDCSTNNGKSNLGDRYAITILTDVDII